MKKPILPWVPWMTALAACSSSSPSGNGAGNISYAAADGGVLDSAPASVAGSGLVVGYASPTGLVNPLEGVAVCVLDHSEIPCVMTDGAGQYALTGIPAGADVGISFTKTGYYGVVSATHSPSADFHEPTLGMFTDALEALFFQGAGWTYPASDKGVLHAHAQSAFNTDCTGLDQTTFAASTGVTPVYESACGDGGVSPGADPTLTATTTNGNGDFLAAPGPIDVTAMHSTQNCVGSPFPGWGWASNANKPNTVSATVLAGHETVVALQCN